MSAGSKEFPFYNGMTILRSKIQSSLPILKNFVTC